MKVYSDNNLQIPTLFEKKYPDLHEKHSGRKPRVLASYDNGDNSIVLYENGTKIRQVRGKNEFPDHCDVKITNFCEDAACAAYCHEKSNRLGLHGDLELLLDIWSDVPAGQECALGGGDPLTHPDILHYLRENKKRGHISNMTVNQYHLEKHQELLETILYEKLVWGLGLSVRDLKSLRGDSFGLRTQNLVLHLILGIHTWKDFLQIKNETPETKILLLGFKTWGNGQKYSQKCFGAIEAEIDNWRKNVPLLLNTPGTLCFDNLAIDQLSIKRYFSPSKWDTFYCGNDGEFSMYFDIVKKEFAVSSTSPTRFPIEDGMKLKDCFTKISELRK